MSRKWTDEIRSDGIALVRNLISDSERKRLIRDVDAALAGTGSPHATRDLMNLVPAARSLASSLREVAREALGCESTVIRGLFFDKTPEANWLVPWHQDLTIAVKAKRNIPGFGPWSTKHGIVHVQPPEPWLSRRVAIRVHLDDCGAENGPLRVIPMTHRRGPLDATAIDAIRASTPGRAALAASRDGLVMSPMLLHASSRAAAPQRRRVVHFEYAADPLPEGMEWHEHDR